MKKRIALGFLLFAMGCGSSKEPALYALESRPGTPANGGPKLVELRRPAIAGYLDRENIVTKVQNYRLDVNTGERWAEPLGDMVGRVLSRDLASRLTDTQVILENGAISASPNATIAVIVQSFDELGDGKVRLIAQVIVESTSPPNDSKVQTYELAAQESGSNTEALVATMSALLGDLAERIAVTIRQLPNTPPPPPAAAPPAAVVIPRQ